MTLRGLHDFLSSLYSSKERADAICRETQQPCETMEQHLYTFLRHSVGLKVLIAAQAKAFLASVETFSNTDVDALIALKILQSDVNEGFRMDAAALKQEACEALKRVLRDRADCEGRGGGSAELVAQEYSARTGLKFVGGGAVPSTSVLQPVSEVEWRLLLDYLGTRFSSASDKGEALGVLEGVVKRGAAAWALGLGDGVALQQQQEGGLGSSLDQAVGGLGEEETAVLINKCNPSRSIPWATIVSALVHMALARQERFLAGFIGVWRAGDVERRGFLSLRDFVAAVASGAPEAVSSARALAGQFMEGKINTITFSQAVECMAMAAEAEEKARVSKEVAEAGKKRAAEEASAAANFAAMEARAATAAREEEIKKLESAMLLAEASAPPPPPPPLPPSQSGTRQSFPQQLEPPSESGLLPFPPGTQNRQNRSRRTSLVLPFPASSKSQAPPSFIQRPSQQQLQTQHFTSMFIPGKGAKVLY